MDACHASWLPPLEAAEASSLFFCGEEGVLLPHFSLEYWGLDGFQDRPLAEGWEWPGHQDCRHCRLPQSGLHVRRRASRPTPTTGAPAFTGSQASSPQCFLLPALRLTLPFLGLSQARSDGQAERLGATPAAHCFQPRPTPGWPGSYGTPGHRRHRIFTSFLHWPPQLASQIVLGRHASLSLTGMSIGLFFCQSMFPSLPPPSSLHAGNVFSFS